MTSQYFFQHFVEGGGGVEGEVVTGNNGEVERKTPRRVGALVLLLILKIKEMALYDKRFLTSDFHLLKYFLLRRWIITDVGDF